MQHVIPLGLRDSEKKSCGVLAPAVLNVSSCSLLLSLANKNEQRKWRTIIMQNHVCAGGALVKWMHFFGATRISVEVRGHSKRCSMEILNFLLGSC